MSSEFTKLFEPGCIGKLQLRNRIVMAPMQLVATKFEIDKYSTNQIQ